MSIILLLLSIILIKAGVDYSNNDLFWTASITIIMSVSISLFELAAFLRWKDKQHD